MTIDQMPPHRTLSRERREAMRHLLTEEVARSTRAPWWRRSRRVLTVGAGAFSLVLAGGAASAGYMFFQPATDVHSVWCYSGASLDDDQRIRAAEAEEVAVAPEASDPEAKRQAVREADEPTTVDDPVALCAQLWEDGVLSAEGQVGEPRFDEPGQTPALTACTLQDGVAAVFPGSSEVCTKLSLPRLEEG